MRESHESISYGAREMRDGVSLSFQSKISPVVTPTAVHSLKPLQAFVKIPGNFPITKIRFKHQQFPKIAEGGSVQDYVQIYLTILQTMAS